ncbi:MFS transporter [Pseudobutyrivibrio xylanivorans]|uniref:Predicted arabinose efflux permease, MFS family n=1 Tax=Pseudobutyrivibrio xylanivorans DSM 14809 TaxID=1123012 RepID=A0A1M6FP13_PSEXY|nr:MFS transporter [Pseudobutyrivibrio xylanivorans]SHI99420.1 Predicted arabinose efflux permease, MFS family [Pseudobutyrivibrio xylanivorans DSM 14809]
MKLFSQYKGLRRANYILFIGRIVTNMGAMIWPMLTLILNKKIGFNATETALFTICSGILFLPANLLGGHVADRFNKKRVIIYCDIVSIALFVISGFLPLSIFSICVLLVGAFFQTLEGPAYQALVADITPAEKREKAFSLLYLGANIGLILSPTLAGLLFNNYLWLCFVISGLSISVSTVLIGLFVKDEKLDEAPTEDVEESADDGLNIWSIIRNSGALIAFIISLAFYQGAYSQFGYLMPLDIAKAFPEKGSVIYGTITSVNCFLVVLFTPIITMVFEKVDLTKKFALGVILQAISFAAFLMSFGIIGGYYISIALFTFGEILTTIMMGAFLAERVPESHRGRIFGATNFAGAFMQGITQFGSGRMFDAFGPAYAWAFSIAMTMVAVIAALMLVYLDKKEFSQLYVQAD